VHSRRDAFGRGHDWCVCDNEATGDVDLDLEPPVVAGIDLGNDRQRRQPRHGVVGCPQDDRISDAQTELLDTARRSIEGIHTHDDRISVRLQTDGARLRLGRRPICPTTSLASLSATRAMSGVGDPRRGLSLGLLAGITLTVAAYRRSR
jgi:hypothetical protein